MIDTPLHPSADVQRRLRRCALARLRGREPLVYGRDWAYEPVVVP